MKILLGVDESAHSRATVASLCAMTWPKGTTVVVLSVIAPNEPQFAPEPVMQASVAGVLSVLENAGLKAHQVLLSETERTLRKAGFETEGRVLDGDPRRALVDAARLEDIDLVVVGSHHHSRWPFAGTVASHVLDHAPCNVLVIKQGPSICNR